MHIFKTSLKKEVLYSALEWSSWSGCSVSCGSEGVQSRWSRCLDTRDMMNCIQVKQLTYYYQEF